MGFQMGAHYKLIFILTLLFCVFIPVAFSGVVFHEPSDPVYSNAHVTVNFTVNMTTYDFFRVDFGNGFGDEFEDQSFFDNILFGDGLRTITVRAYTSPSSFDTFTRTFTVDTENPEVFIYSPISQTYWNEPVLVNLSFYDKGGLASYSYTVFDSSNSVDQSGSGSLSGTNDTATFNLSPLSIGDYVLEVIVFDQASRNDTKTVSFSYDEDFVPPTLSNETPINGSFINTTSVDLFFQAFDAGIGLHTLYFLWDNNKVNTQFFPSAPNGQLSATVTATDQQNHTVTFFANDSLGNNISRTHWFVVDTIAPSIDILHPEPRPTELDAYNMTELDINVSISDDFFIENATLNVFVNNVLNNSISLVPNATLNTVIRDSLYDLSIPNYQFFDERNITLEVEAFDRAGNKQVETVSFWVINPLVGHPKMTINVSPISNYVTRNGTIWAVLNTSDIRFIFDVSDNTAVKDVRWLDGSLSPTGIIFCSNINKPQDICIQDAVGISDGFYNETFMVRDIFLKNNTNTTQFIIDTKPPELRAFFLNYTGDYQELSQIGPAPVLNYTEVTFNMSLFDEVELKNVTYSVTADRSTQIFSGSTSFTPGDTNRTVEFTFDLLAFDEYDSTLTVIAYDLVGNRVEKSFDFIVFNMTENPPNISIEKPSLGSTYTNSLVDFDIRVVDNGLLDTIRYTLINSTGSVKFSERKQLTPLLVNETVWEFQRDIEVDDNYTLVIFAYDTFGKNNTETIDFVVDANPPVIDVFYEHNDTFEVLQNNSRINQTQFRFNISLFDTIGLQNVSFYFLNDTSKGFRSSTLSGNRDYFVTDVDFADYDLSLFDEQNVSMHITAFDISGNNRTKTLYFTPVNMTENKPNVTILSPDFRQNNNVTNQQDLFFLFNITDNGIIDTVWYEVFDLTRNEQKSFISKNFASDGLSQLLYTEETYSFSQDGNYSLRVWANDTFGKEEYQEYSFIIDSTPPTIDIVQIHNMTFNQIGQKFDVTGNISNVTFKVNFTDMFGVDNASISVSSPTVSSNILKNISFIQKSSSEEWIFTLNLTDF
ncbi:MAG: hypothetical protein ACMXYA_01390, partial [Candidatus Woesearchaeota archaeon]